MTASSAYLGYHFAQHPEDLTWSTFFAITAAFILAEMIKGGFFTEILPELFELIRDYFLDLFRPDPFKALEKYKKELEQKVEKMTAIRKKLEGIQKQNAQEAAVKLKALEEDAIKNINKIPCHPKK